MILGSIVLAGGSSSRMGTSKAGLAWGDRTLLLHTVEMLLDFTYPVAVVSRDQDFELPPLHTECDLIFDQDPGGGPLQAIETGMAYVFSRCDAVLVTSCDMPFLDGKAVEWLADQLGDHTGVIPVVDGKPQPLCGIFSERALPKIRELVQGGERRALALAELPGIQLLSEEKCRTFDPELRFLRDIDTPEDYEQARRDAGQA